MQTNHSNVTPSVEKQDQTDTCDVVAGSATSHDNPKQTGIGSFKHAGNDMVHTIAKRPAARASMCAPAITASGKTHPSAINENRAALKPLLDRGAKTPLPDLNANADASFTALFTPVSRNSTDTEDYEKNTPVLNIADIPANVSLASLAAARDALDVSESHPEPKTAVASTEENADDTTSCPETHIENVLHEMFEGRSDAAQITEQPASSSISASATTNVTQTESTSTASSNSTESTSTSASSGSTEGGESITSSLVNRLRAFSNGIRESARQLID